MFAHPLVDLAGWAGAACVLAAYGLISAGRLQGRSTGYQVLNALGSALLAVNTFFYRAYPSSLVNVLWLLIALWTLGAGRRARGW